MTKHSHLGRHMALGGVAVMVMVVTGLHGQEASWWLDDRCHPPLYVEVVNTTNYGEYTHEQKMEFYREWLYGPYHWSANSGLYDQTEPPITIQVSEYLDDASRRYNCHSYAWWMYDKMVNASNNVKAYNHADHYKVSWGYYWLNDPKPYVTSGCFPLVNHIKTPTAYGRSYADWFNDIHETPRRRAFYNYQLGISFWHSGVVYHDSYTHWPAGVGEPVPADTRILVVSKWGRGGLIKHEYWNCPYVRDSKLGPGANTSELIEYHGEHNFQIHDTPEDPTAVMAQHGSQAMY